MKLANYSKTISLDLDFDKFCLLQMAISHYRSWLIDRIKLENDIDSVECINIDIYIFEDIFREITEQFVNVE